jgi:hypothetical protein
MAESRRASDDPLDYVALVLYVRRGVEVCDRLLARVAAAPDVKVVDVRSVEPRPAWLTGVPTCVRPQGGPVHRGSEAVRVIEAHCAAQLRAAPAPSGGARAASFGCAAHDDACGAAYEVGASDVAGSLAAGFLHQAPMRDEPPAALTLDEMMRRRGAA